MKSSPKNPHLLFYAGGSQLSAESQERLRQYILEGGHLVCLGSYPRFDERSRPLNLLKIPEPDGIIGDVPETLKVAINTGEVQATVRTSWLAYYKKLPDDPIHAVRMLGETLTAEELNLIFSLVKGDEYTVGFSREWGQGKLTVVNLSPSEEIVRALHQMAGVNIPVTSKTPDILTALYSRDGVMYVIVMNNSSEDKSALIAIDPEILEPGNYQIGDLISGEKWLEKHSNIHSLNVNLQRKDATILKISLIESMENQ